MCRDRQHVKHRGKHQFFILKIYGCANFAAKTKGNHQLICLVVFCVIGDAMGTDVDNGIGYSEFDEFCFLVYV